MKRLNVQPFLQMSAKVEREITFGEWGNFVSFLRVYERSFIFAVALCHITLDS